MSKKKLAKKVLVLRTCEPDMSSYGGFVWPESGRVTATYWDAKPECGNGLHGLLWGRGDGELLNWNNDVKWLVVAVDSESVVDLGGKVKFPAGDVVHCGDRKSATDYIIANGADATNVVGAFITGGDRATVTGGHRATVTGGDRATLLLLHWDGMRNRIMVAYVGEGGIKPGAAYRLSNGKFVANEQRGG